MDDFELNKQSLPCDLDIPIDSNKQDINLTFEPFVNTYL